MVTQLGPMPVTSSQGAGVAAIVAPVGSTNSPAAAALPLGEQGQPSRRSAAENRRSNKPIMEKKRRARINNCLNELKTLILDAMKKDPARHSKLEKADILEMTVKHLETLQRQQAALIAATDPAVLNKFRAGFNECINEVGRFPGLETGVRRRLVQHLSCVNAHMGTGTTSAASGTSTPQQPLQVHILPATSTEPPAPPAPVSTVTTTAGIFLSNAGVPLVPTRLANGDLALVLPSSYRTTTASPAPSSAGSSMSSSISVSSSSSSPVPMLVPIPNRTPSRDSPPVAFDRLQVNNSPISSPKPLSPSPVIMASPSPVIMASPTPVIMASPSCVPSVPSPSMPMVLDDRAYSPPMAKPLSLVMRKTVCRPQDHHWRPW